MVISLGRCATQGHVPCQGPPHLHAQARKNKHEWEFFVGLDGGEETRFIDHVEVRLHQAYRPSSLRLEQPPFMTRWVSRDHADLAVWLDSAELPHWGCARGSVGGPLALVPRSENHVECRRRVPGSLWPGRHDARARTNVGSVRCASPCAPCMLAKLSHSGLAFHSHRTSTGSEVRALVTFRSEYQRPPLWLVWSLDLQGNGSSQTLEFELQKGGLPSNHDLETGGRVVE